MSSRPCSSKVAANGSSRNPLGNGQHLENYLLRLVRTIRKRILNTIKSTWGGRRYSSGSAYRGNGKIRIATWTFDDMAIARSLYWAHKRGVSVQVLAAKDTIVPMDNNVKSLLR